jgi:hypothetical protein
MATQVSIEPQNAIDFDINSVFLFQLLCDKKPFGIISLRPSPNDFYVPRRRRSNLALKELQGDGSPVSKVQS